MMIINHFNSPLERQKLVWRDYQLLPGNMPQQNVILKVQVQKGQKGANEHRKQADVTVPIPNKIV